MFSSCGTMIASGDGGRIVRIWNVLSGACDCAFQGHSEIVTDVCWLTPWNQVVSASDDCTVHIWDVQKKTCLKIFAQYHEPVVALASSQGLLLMASKFGTVNIYDSQSGHIIHVISSNGITDSCFSIDRGKVLVASGHLGDIWDITTKMLMHVRSIEYNGEQATFSPDGTCIASIYGKFLKIWKTNAGYNHHEVPTHVHDTVDSIYISPDEQLVTLQSKKGADILDVNTGQSLFTYPVAKVLSMVFSLDSAFVAFLSPSSTVCTWNAHTHLHKNITIDDNVFHIALSPNGSQLASLSSCHMKLWDLESEEWLAHLEFDSPLEGQAQISFSTDVTVSILEKSHGMQSWHISSNHNVDLTRNFIKNSDSTMSWLIPPSWKSLENCDGIKLPMVFIPTTEEQSNQDVSTPCQPYHCDMDDEWILDQDRRGVLWIPPDERPSRKIWNGFKCEKKVLVQTESGKIYFVKFLQS